MWVTCWYILHSIQTCLLILELLLEHELPERLEKSLGDIAREGLLHQVSVTWRKQALTYAHFQVSEGRCGGGSGGGGEGKKRNNSKQQEEGEREEEEEREVVCIEQTQRGIS